MAPGMERVRGAYRVVKTLYKICIARRLVVDIFPWCNAKFVPFPSGTLVARRKGNGRIPNALCWPSRKYNCACALLAEVQLRLRVTRRSWQKLFAGKNFVKILKLTKGALHY